MDGHNRNVASPSRLTLSEVARSEPNGDERELGYRAARLELEVGLLAIHAGGHPLEGYSRERRLGWDEAIATVRAELAR